MLNEAQIDACADYVLEQTRFVIEEFEPRPPGSEGEAQCQRLIKVELESCCDGEVRLEPFPVAQRAFMGMQRVAGIVMVLAFAAYWIQPWIAAALSTLALVIVVQQLGRYKLLLDPFFKEHTSHNVSGRQAPAGPVKRRIILNGHPDGAFEWRFLERYPRRFPLFTLAAILGLPLKLVTDWAFALTAGTWATENTQLWLAVGAFQVLLIPSALIAIFWANFGVVSPGANDNLSGSFIATGIAKYLREAGIRLQNTELMVAITGSEEAGLRGAKVFARDYKAALGDVETVVLALDTFRDLDHLTIYSRDLNGTVRHDPAVCQLLKDAGTNLGFDLPYGSVFLGSTDATAFTQQGYRAAALAAMDPAPAHWYHNRRDHHTNMDKACIARSIAVVCEAIRLYDAAGLPEPRRG